MAFEHLRPHGGSKSIPFEYRGVRFRSKLEARWALTFDTLGWTWKYENLWFPGYLADFEVIFTKVSYVVEVKPYRAFDQALQLALAMEPKVHPRIPIVLGASSALRTNSTCDRMLENGVFGAAPRRVVMLGRCHECLRRSFTLVAEDSAQTHCAWCDSLARCAPEPESFLVNLWRISLEATRRDPLSIEANRGKVLPSIKGHQTHSDNRDAGANPPAGRGMGGADGPAR